MSKAGLIAKVTNNGSTTDPHYSAGVLIGKNNWYPIVEDACGLFSTLTKIQLAGGKTRRFRLKITNLKKRTR